MISVVRNWAMSCGSLILFLTYLLPAKTPAAFHVARAVASVLLVIGLMISDRKLRRWLAEPAAKRNVPAPRRGVPSSRLLPPTEVQPLDWDASRWDPDVQADIERRRHRDAGR
jgi:hypothetical protein